MMLFHLRSNKSPEEKETMNMCWGLEQNWTKLSSKCNQDLSNCTM